MKVRISYTVDAEEIPKRMNDLLDEAYKILSELKNNPIKQIKQDNLLESIESVEHVRKQLFNIDNKLSDCYNILAGYAQSLLSAKLENNNEGGEGDIHDPSDES